MNIAPATIITPGDEPGRMALKCPATGDGDEMRRELEFKAKCMDEEFEKLAEPLKWDWDDAILDTDAQHAELLLATARHADRQPAGCLGLAAPQIGIRRPMFAYRDPNDSNPDVRDPWTVALQPEITEVSAETGTMPETCLSMPGVEVDVERPASIVVDYKFYRSNPVTTWAPCFGHGQCEVNLRLSGLVARVFLHEYDHLLGAIITDSKEEWAAKRPYLKLTRKESKQ